MTELKCSVRSCSFQKDDCCCRGNITVEGAHANRNSETSCGSFEEKKTVDVPIRPVNRLR